MARKITTKTGDVSADLSGDGLSFTEQLLKLAAPKTYKLIQEEFEKILEEARQEWPVRKTGSRGSKKKLSMGIRMSAEGEVVAFISNSAPYAWAIKSGKESETVVPYGKRVANELLWKPVKRASNKIARQLADEIVKK